MTWFWLALTTAGLEAVKDAFSKHSVKHFDEALVAWSWSAFSLPFLLVFLVFQDWPTLQTAYWWSLGISGVLNLIAYLWYIKALKYGDLSNTVPLLAISPLFLLVTSPLILGEYPSLLGLGGVLLIVAGSYILNFQKKNQGFLAPFLAMFQETGPRYMLGVALLWGITANLDKTGIQASSPLAWIIGLNSALSVGFLPLVLPKLKTLKHGKTLRALLPIGLMNALSLLSQMTALQMALVPYVISIKRTSTLMSAVLGFVVFKEKGFKERLLGALVMLAGMACMIWS